MAHKEQLDFFNNLGEIIVSNKKLSEINILEIGSYDVNGSVRDIFKESNYLGIDLINGPGVDLVMNGEDIKKLNKKFDIIISSECFEHAVNWKKIFLAMIDCVKDNGYIIMTCASTGRIEHGTKRSDFFFKMESSPGTKDNYYKNLNKKDFFQNFDISKIFERYFFFYNIHSFDLYFVGQKKTDSNSNDIDKLEKKVILDNSFKPSIKSNKRFLLHSILPQKFCNDLHFKNLERKLKRNKNVEKI